MTPQLIATDLDGTLLRRDLTVSSRSVTVLDRATQAGIGFAMVTGRPVRWLPAVLTHTGVRGPVVCANGAVIYDPERDEIIQGSTLAPQVLAEVIAAMRRELPGVVFAVEIEHGRAMISETAWPAIPDDVGHRVVAGTELSGRPAVKLLARVSDAPPDEFLAYCTRLLAGTAQVTTSSRRAMVEISAAGVTKATGLAWLAERMAVNPDRVVAYGDMPNDLPMFAWAGRGVAVANAHPALLDVADEVTGTNDEDGVARHLEKLLA